MATMPSMTKTFHHDTYSAIDPTKRPELSLKGKKIVISGGGAGIGRGITQAFADAGAATIAILGRREAMLQETKREVEAKHNEITVLTLPADVTDIAAVEKAAEEIGKWDVLVSNAGYLPKPELVTEADPEEWWKGFEINAKGTFVLARSFLPNRNPGSTFISVNAGSIQVEMMASRFSGYNASKFAALKILDSVASENKDLHVVSMHPGVVESDMSAKTMTAKTDGGFKPPKFDKIELPSHFAVWLCSDEAKFLRGKFVWCNWDIEELKAKKGEIEGSLLLTANCMGWPYSP